MNEGWTVKYFYTEDGKVPFSEWFNKLDVSVRKKVDPYITRMRAGNFSNCKPLKGIPDICELVMDFGPGYRAYYIRAGKVLLLMFCGGIKKGQKADVNKAVKYHGDFKKRLKAGKYHEPELGEQHEKT